MPSMPVERAAADERGAKLGRWMAAMLHRQGYRDWAAHKAAVQGLALNAFPEIRPTPAIARVTDLMGVLSAHFDLERSWATHQETHGAAFGGMYTV